MSLNSKWSGMQSTIQYVLFLWAMMFSSWSAIDMYNLMHVGDDQAKALIYCTIFFVSSAWIMFITAAQWWPKGKI